MKSNAFEVNHLKQLHFPYNSLSGYNSLVQNPAQDLNKKYFSHVCEGSKATDFSFKIWAAATIPMP